MFIVTKILLHNKTVIYVLFNINFSQANIKYDIKQQVKSSFALIKRITRCCDTYYNTVLCIAIYCDISVLQNSTLVSIHSSAIPKYATNPLLRNSTFVGICSGFGFTEPITSIKFVPMVHQYGSHVFRQPHDFYRFALLVVTRQASVAVVVVGRVH